MIFTVSQEPCASGSVHITPTESDWFLLRESPISHLYERKSHSGLFHFPIFGSQWEI